MPERGSGHAVKESVRPHAFSVCGATPLPWFSNECINHAVIAAAPRVVINL